MTAYRRPPPPPRWQIVYRLPLFDRIGRSATMVVFAGITVLGLGAMIIAPIVGGVVAFAVAGFGAMAAITTGMYLGIVWMTRLPETAERKIDQISGDERGCRVFSEGERWTLPVGADKLRVGQVIRVRFREVAPESDLEPGREVLEVRAIEE